jgi:hypothetical protein
VSGHRHTAAVVRIVLLDRHKSTVHIHQGVEMPRLGGRVTVGPVVEIAVAVGSTLAGAVDSSIGRSFAGVSRLMRMASAAAHKAQCYQAEEEETIPHVEVASIGSQVYLPEIQQKVGALEMTVCVELGEAPRRSFAGQVVEARNWGYAAAEKVEMTAVHARWQLHP